MAAMLRQGPRKPETAGARVAVAAAAAVAGRKELPFLNSTGERHGRLTSPDYFAGATMEPPYGDSFAAWSVTPFGSAIHDPLSNTPAVSLDTTAPIDTFVPKSAASSPLLTADTLHVQSQVPWSARRSSSTVEEAVQRFRLDAASIVQSFLQGADTEILRIACVPRSNDVGGFTKGTLASVKTKGNFSTAPNAVEEHSKGRGAPLANVPEWGSLEDIPVKHPPEGNLVISAEHQAGRKKRVAKDATRGFHQESDLKNSYTFDANNASWGFEQDSSSKDSFLGKSELSADKTRANNASWGFERDASSKNSLMAKSGEMSAEKAGANDSLWGFEQETKISVLGKSDLPAEISGTNDVSWGFEPQGKSDCLAGSNVATEAVREFMSCEIDSKTPLSGWGFNELSEPSSSKVSPRAFDNGFQDAQGEQSLIQPALSPTATWDPHPMVLEASWGSPTFDAAVANKHNSVWATASMDPSPSFSSHDTRPPNPYIVNDTRPPNPYIVNDSWEPRPPNPYIVNDACEPLAAAAQADTTKSATMHATESLSVGSGIGDTSLNSESPDVKTAQAALNQSNFSSCASDWRRTAATSPAGASLRSQDSCDDGDAAPLDNRTAPLSEAPDTIDALSFPRPVNVFNGDGGSRSSARKVFSVGPRPHSQVSKHTVPFDRPQSVSSSPPPFYQSSLSPSIADGQSPTTLGAKLGAGSPTKPTDDSADEVTRHLLCARSKIEAVEHEFAQIMSELTAYSERIPPKRSPAAPAASPPSGTTRNSRGAGAAPRDFPEHFFVGTPLAPHDDSANISSSSALGRVQMESLSE